MAELTVNQQAAACTASQIKLPELRDDLTLYPGPAQADGSPSWTLYDPLTNKYFRLGWVEHKMLKYWLQDTLQQFQAILQARAGLCVSIRKIEQTMDFLERNQLVKARHQAKIQQLHKQFITQSQQSLSSKLLKHYFFFRIPLVRPDAFLRKTLPVVRLFYRKSFTLTMIAIALAGLYLTFRQWDVFQATIAGYFSLDQFYWYFFALAVTKILHEFGHAYTAKTYQCNVASMGIAFMIFWPILYTDTTGAWKLKSKKQRLHIGAAGVIVELWIAILATFLWSFFAEGPLRGALVLLASIAWISTLAINLNPFMRFDGYYLLSDLLEVPNLQSRAFALTRWRLREWLFKFDEPPPEIYSRKMQNTLVFYGFSTWIYRLILYLGIAVLVYHLVFKLAGIILMLTEVLVLIGLPVYAEAKEWWRRRNKLHWNSNTLLSSMLLITLIVLLILPWKSYIEAPAVLSAKLHTELYPPTSAKIDAIRVKLGQEVAKDETLIILDAPDLLHQLSRINQRIAALNWEINHAVESLGVLSHQPVMEQELVTMLTKKKGYQQQLEQLTIRAPFAGTIVALQPDLHQGAWVSPKTTLVKLVNLNSARVEAYLSESEFARITDPHNAVFYPDDSAKPAIKLAFENADISSNEILQSPYLASQLGGKIDTITNSNNEMIPRVPVYRWEFSTAPANNKVTQEAAGTVHLAAKPQSLLANFTDSVMSALIRESGF